MFTLSFTKEIIKSIKKSESNRSYIRANKYVMVTYGGIETAITGSTDEDQLFISDYANHIRNLVVLGIVKEDDQIVVGTRSNGNNITDEAGLKMYEVYYNLKKKGGDYKIVDMLLYSNTTNNVNPFKL